MKSLFKGVVMVALALAVTVLLTQSGLPRRILGTKRSSLS